MKRLMTFVAMLLFGILLAAQAAPVASATAPVKRPTIRQRQANQQRRIGQGIKSGQLTAREGARLERKEARVNREVARDRAANGGKLTPGERRSINRQQNRLSRQIYRQKHNAHVRK